MAGSGRDGELHFPDLPKLELDELIDQLVESARGVQRAQGRLRALLRAVDAVTGELSVDNVLHRLVEAARELAGAQYAALGVIAYDGGLEQFIPLGTDDDVLGRVGRLPQGKGLLGALVTEARPIRLSNLAEDDRAVGFPPGHPPMTSFLGVPIRVRGDVFGNLYLANSVKGEFTTEDEELVVALAAAAGTAISNARLYHESRLQQRWLSASIEIAAELLGAGGQDPLELIARRSHDLADADAVSLSLLDDAGDLEICVAIGSGAESLVGQRFPPDATLGGVAIRRGQPLLRTAETAERPPVLAPILESGPVMAVPLQGSAAMRGVLTIARSRGRRPFTEGDLAMAAGFAGHASVALELADVRRREQRLAVFEDRERIARDLHDHVIQELFAIGLGLEGAVAALGSDEAAARKVQERVDDIDRTIRRIRTSIFALQGPHDVHAAGVRRQVLDIADQLTPVLGFAPHVTFVGPVDSRAPHGLLDDVAAVVREALTNIARHADATTASVGVEIDDTALKVIVVDDGGGTCGAVRQSGLANLRARATARGGDFDVIVTGDGGTQLEWRVPLE